MNILFILFFCLAPLAAQETEAAPAPAAETEPQAAAAEMPKELAEAKLSIRSQGISKTYDETVGELFLNKSFLSLRMSDGTQRSFAYKTGQLLDNTYMLPLEMRSNGRLFSIYKFFFTFDGQGEADLVRWEEINYVSRQILRYTGYADLEKGIGFFQSIQPKAKKKAPIQQEESLNLKEEAQ